MQLFIVASFLLLANAVYAKPRIAVCFFGLTRSLRTTSSLIHQRLLKPLKSVGVVDVFVHTYNLTHIVNPRSKEFNVTNSASDLLLLLPTASIVDDQTAFLNTVPSTLCKLRGDPWGDKFKSLSNLFCQLNSLDRVTSLFQDHGPFDVVVFARPDVIYYTAIDAQQVISAATNTIYLPPFADYGGYNDRFAFGKPLVMAMYGKRQSRIAEYCKTNRPHSETFIKWLIQQSGVSVKRTPILFGRMRSPDVIVERPSWQMQPVINTSLDNVLEQASVN